MSKTLFRILVAGAVVALGVVGRVGIGQAANNQNCYTNTATASTTSAAGADHCTNEQNGDNDGSTDQSGDASSGDGVAGQVAGVVSAGDASVDATNRSDDVSVDTGDAIGNNSATLRTGLEVIFTSTGAAPNNNQNCFNNLGNATTTSSSGARQCTNRLLGDNDGEASQQADAASGDGVGGQVIGVVTSAGGSADLVLDNESTDAKVDSGDGKFNNNGNVFVGEDVNFTATP